MRTGGGKCGNAPHTFKPAIGPYKTEAGLESEIGTPGRALRGGHSGEGTPVSFPSTLLRMCAHLKM